MERALAYVGAIPHWLYFKPLRESTPWWRAAVLWLTALAALATMSGWLLGLIRTGRIVRRSRGFSPFRRPWFRWHHLAGLLFGPVVFTWLFSGALSLEPFAWKSLGNSTRPSIHRQWRGGLFLPLAFSQSVSGLLTLCRNSLEAVVELAPRQVMKRPYQLCFGRKESRLAWQDNGSLKQALFLDRQTLQTALRVRDIDSPVEIKAIVDGDSLEVQRRHEVSNHNLVRVNWPSNPELTVYVDRASAQVTAVYDSRERLERWLYHGLHNLDFPALYRHPDLWLLLILALLSGGTVVTLSACRLALRPWLRMGAHQRTRNSL